VPRNIIRKCMRTLINALINVQIQYLADKSFEKLKINEKIITCNSTLHNMLQILNLNKKNSFKHKSMHIQSAIRGRKYFFALQPSRF